MKVEDCTDSGIFITKVWYIQLTIYLSRIQQTESCKEIFDDLMQAVSGFFEKALGVLITQKCRSQKPCFLISIWSNDVSNQILSCVDLLLDALVEVRVSLHAKHPITDAKHLDLAWIWESKESGTSWKGWNMITMRLLHDYWRECISCQRVVRHVLVYIRHCKEGIR